MKKMHEPTDAEVEAARAALYAAAGRMGENQMFAALTAANAIRDERLRAEHLATLIDQADHAADYGDDANNRYRARSAAQWLRSCQTQETSDA